MPKTRDHNSNVSLSELKEGALEELYQHALGLILKNIEDPSTKANAKRQLIIAMEFAPTKDRSVAAIDVKVTAKLAAPEPVQTTFILKQDRGAIFAFEPQQEKLFADDSAN